MCLVLLIKYYVLYVVLKIKTDNTNNTVIKRVEKKTLIHFQKLLRKN